MSTSAPEQPKASSVSFTQDTMTVSLEDGRTIHIPLDWFPRLNGATEEQLRDYRLVGDGIGIHWTQLDEDLSVRSLLYPTAKGVQQAS